MCDSVHKSSSLVALMESAFPLRFCMLIAKHVPLMGPYGWKLLGKISLDNIWCLVGASVWAGG